MAARGHDLIQLRKLEISSLNCLLELQIIWQKWSLVTYIKNKNKFDCRGPYIPGDEASSTFVSYVILLETLLSSPLKPMTRIGNNVVEMVTM